MKQLKISVNGKQYDVTVEEVNASASPVIASAAAPAPAAAPAAAPAPAPAAPAPAPAAAPAAGSANGTKIECPMPGVILRIPVTVGQQVKKNDVVIVLEAMKMENEIFAPCDGKISAVNVSVGESVESGAALAFIE